MNKRILIVDDSPLLRATARRAALQAGASPLHVREVGNGADALEELRRDPVDVVLLDLNMPVMDGYQFIEEKARDRTLDGIRVALVTTEGNQQRLARLKELGVEHYLRKPFEPEDLRDLVQSMFGDS